MAQAKKPADSKSGKKKTTTAAETKKPIRREIAAIICLFLGLFSLIGYFNVDAWFISFFCGLIKGIIGWGYYIFPPVLLIASFNLAFHRGRPVILRTCSLLMLPILFGAFAHLLFCREYEFTEGLVGLLFDSGKLMKSGGLVSGVTSMILEGTFSIYGAAPVLVFLFAFLVMLAFSISPTKIAESVKNRPRLEYEPEPEPLFDAPPAKKIRKRAAIDIPLEESLKIPPEEYEEERVGFFNTRPRVKTPDQLLSPEVELEPEPEEDFVLIKPAVEEEPFFFQPKLEPEPVPEPQPVPVAQVISDPPKSAPRAAPVATAIAPEFKSEKIKKDDVAAEATDISRAIEQELSMEAPVYEFPPLDLLRTGKRNDTDGRQEIAANRERLDTTLKSFGVNARIVGVTRGPAVTRYDLELEAGVKLNKLTNLAGDLALSLGVSNVRIAPIPDKISTVGIEVPNRAVSTVYLRNIISSPSFSGAASRLTFAIGEDIGGNAIVGNISKLPHMLIAGTTGSGKSVCMNSLILSLLYKATPDEVRLIMIDPKMVELGIYNGIPHLFIPVVTDPKKAAGALQWSVVEMLKRYRLFSEVGVRDLAGYNAHQRRLGEETLPQVVIVIDELADLMLVASKEVEESICRVAQMGRASGMHLIIATQRPSADVITGLMKANIPSRIAFAVSSALESRIILDTMGAEKLVGSGDMLYSPIGSGKPLRVQGAFVSDEEREEVISFIKAGSQPEYSSEILDQIERAAVDTKDSKNGNGGAAVAVAGDSPFAGFDELLPDAVEVILETKQASVSMLQRRLKLGYSRAARIVDQMEELGVVGPFEGSKPRQLMVTREQWQEIQLTGGGAVPTGGESEFAALSAEFGVDEPTEQESDEAPWDDED